MSLVVRFQLLFLIQICCHYATATVVLDSSVGLRATCPEEMVTYTCTVNQGALLDWIVEPFLPASTRIRFTSTTPTGRRYDCNGVPTLDCADFNFVATLTNTFNSTTVTSGILADMTTTLTFTSTASLNGTVVHCSGATEAGFPMTNHTLTVTGTPSPPRTPSATVQLYGRDNVTLTVQWQPPQYDGGAPVNYTITVSPGLSPVTTSGTSVPVTVPYNVIHTVSIVATNCNGSSSAAMVTIPAIVDCGPPVAPQHASMNYTTTIEGSVAFYSCDPGLFPEGRMRSACTRNGWSPNPAGLTCSSLPTTIPTFDCGPPFAPREGSLETYTETMVGSEVFYSCNQGLLPEGRMRAVCTRNGWSPNPADLSCTVGCSSTDLTPTDRQCTDRGFANTMPMPSGVVCYSGTTAGSEAVYICDDGFHQNGAATRVCQSNGVWNGSMPQCFLDQGRQDDTVEPLTTGAIVGIAVVSTAVVAFVTGILAGITIYHFISKHRSHQSLKPETSSQQPQTVSSSDSVQQTGPEYAEVIKLRKNRAYELTHTGVEMRANEAYQPSSC